MSTQGNAVKGAASEASDAAEAPQPLIAPTGSASLDVLVGDINDAAAPFQSLSDPEASALDKANAAIGGTLSAITTPLTLLNDGFALATRDVAKLFPAMPAATLGMLHLGIPHLHLHPPAMPIPLPSLGPVVLAGCASVLINGIPAARAGDLGISVLCGTFAPPFEVFTGSSKVFIGGARAARMLDVTLHCMPGAGVAKAMGSLAKVVSIGGGVVGVGAGALDAAAKAEDGDARSAAIAGVQAGLDAAALALSLLMGLDPGMPPCIGAVLTGHPNVLIGGFPMPPWSAVARGLGKLGKGLAKRGPRTSKQGRGKCATCS
ncbi:PAAR domain-containing protein [Sorangium sp. So ce1036]|uniref:PAAR domain-containing protein n=1 Tax=Sorangium sp. So ce1036 TaxID=3133328 RepID=UPI003EFD87C4